ncbi:Hypothetical predicted protein [Podarcis lilfordi]|nr:Hypothetical predicted protein [Podarcis lilfordi]
MYIPLDGEFILAPGAGFAAFDGSFDPGCETASEVTFASADNFQWYDPTLWRAATSLDNLDRGKHIFSVDEERVPCQYDDVIFPPETSFRVNIESSEQAIRLRSISVLGQKFTSDNTLAEYMQSSSAKLQFHGQGAFQLLNTRCPDKSGCECGNAADHDRICAALLQKSGNQCPQVMCKDPLKPVGHCCEMCGVPFGIAVRTLHAATGSNRSTQEAGATIAGTVVVLFLVLLLLGAALLLYRKGTLRSFTSLWSRKRDLDLSGETADKGFDNPIFDTPCDPVALAGACSVEEEEEAPKEMASKNSELYYINPLYDETELCA